MVRKLQTKCAVSLSLMLVLTQGCALTNPYPSMPKEDLTLKQDMSIESSYLRTTALREQYVIALRDDYNTNTGIGGALIAITGLAAFFAATSASSDTLPLLATAGGSIYAGSRLITDSKRRELNAATAKSLGCLLASYSGLHGIGSTSKSDVPTKVAMLRQKLAEADAVIDELNTASAAIPDTAKNAYQTVVAARDVPARAEIAKNIVDAAGFSLHGDTVAVLDRANMQMAAAQPDIGAIIVTAGGSMPKLPEPAKVPPPPTANTSPQPQVKAIANKLLPLARDIKPLADELNSFTQRVKFVSSFAPPEGCSTETSRITQMAKVFAEVLREEIKGSAPVPEQAPATPVNPTPVTTPKSDERIKALQEALIAKGYTKTTAGKVLISDGLWGPATEELATKYVKDTPGLDGVLAVTNDYGDIDQLIKSLKK